MSVAVTYVCLHGELSSSKIFKLIAWLEFLRISIFIALGFLTQESSQAYFSIQRIQVSKPWQPFVESQLFGRVIFSKKKRWKFYGVLLVLHFFLYISHKRGASSNWLTVTGVPLWCYVLQKFLLTGELEEESESEKAAQAAALESTTNRDISRTGGGKVAEGESNTKYDDDDHECTQGDVDDDDGDILLSLRNVTAVWNAPLDQNHSANHGNRFDEVSFCYTFTWA